MKTFVAYDESGDGEKVEISTSLSRKGALNVLLKKNRCIEGSTAGINITERAARALAMHILAAYPGNAIRDYEVLG